MSDNKKYSYEEYRNFTVQCEVLMPDLVDPSFDESDRLHNIQELLKQNNKFLAAINLGTMEIPKDKSPEDIASILKGYDTLLSEIREAIVYRPPSLRYK
jgi:hypothetical protein